MDHLSPAEPEIPEDIDYLWQWFWDLNRCRSSGVNGPEPIAFRDIAEWSRMTGNIIRPPEVDVIMGMDEAYRKGVADELAALQDDG